MDLYTQIFLAAISIIFNVVFIPIYGMNGAAFAASSSLAIYNIIKVIYVKVKFGILPFDKSIIKVLIGTAITITVTLIFNRIVNFDRYYLILEVGIITIINYGIILLSGLSKGEFDRLKQFVARK